MKIFILFVAVTVLVGACKQNPTNPSTSAIVGTWYWTQSVGGIAGVTLKANDAEPRLVYFKADGTYLDIRNHVTVANHDYKLIRGKSIFSEDIVDMVLMPTTGEMQNTYVISRLTSDTLVLDDNHVDGFTSTYVRVIEDPLR